MAKNTINISVLADTVRAQKAFRDLNTSMGSTAALKRNVQTVGRALESLGKKIAVVGGGFAVFAVKSASDLEQSTGTINDVFKTAAGAVHDYAAQAAAAVGLSESSYNELAAILGSQLKNGGTALDELAGKTNQLISLGADLSAGFGGSTVEAVNAISSALKGERDPIERYGVSLKQAGIDAEAARLGFQKVGGSFDNQAQQAATLSLIMKQTADMTGKFSREQDTLAHNVQVAKAEFTNLAAHLGGTLLPVATQAMQYVSGNILPNLARFKPLLIGLGSAAGVILAGAAAFRVYTAAMQTWRVVSAAAVIAQAALNAVMMLNPMTAIATTIALVIAGLVALAVRFNLVSTTVQAFGKAWQATKDAISHVWNAIKAGVSNMASNVASTLGQLPSRAVAIFSNMASSVASWIGRMSSTAFRLYASYVTGVLRILGSLPGRVAGVMGRFASAVWSGIQSAIGFLRRLPSLVVHSVGNMGNLLVNAGRSVIQGFISGIVSMFSNVKNTLGNLTKKLTSWKGPLPRDRTILQGAGRAVIGGFVRGLESQYGRVRQSLGGLTAELPSMINADSNLSLELNARGSASSGVVINVTAQMLEPTPAAGRTIARALENYVTIGGRA